MDKITQKYMSELMRSNHEKLEHEVEIENLRATIAGYEAVLTSDSDLNELFEEAKNKLIEEGKNG